MDRQTIESITTSDELVEHALEAYESPLIHYAASIVHDVERAKDIVQDTYIKLYKQDVDKMKGGLKSWLYTVCRNRALDVLRKEKRMVSVEDEIISNEATTEASPDRLAAKTECLKSIMEHMQQLSENQRTCIQMKFQLGLSYAEISQKTGLKSGNIGFLIHNGLKKLRESLPSIDQI